MTDASQRVQGELGKEKLEARLRVRGREGGRGEGGREEGTRGRRVRGRQDDADVGGMSGWLVVGVSRHPKLRVLQKRSVRSSHEVVQPPCCRRPHLLRSVQ